MPFCDVDLAELPEGCIVCMQWWHTVLLIQTGLPIPHDVMYDGQVTKSRLVDPHVLVLM